MRRVSAVGLVLLTGVFLTFCGRTPTPGPHPTTGAPVSTAEPAASTSALTGVTLTDALERTVHFDSIPQRIAIIGKGSVMVIDAIYMFPQVPERVRVLTRGGQMATGDFVAIVDPLYSQKIWLERDAGPEQVAATQPDAVILKSYLSDSVGALLEELGIPVVYVDLETPDHYERDILILGQLLGDVDRATEVIGYYRSQKASVAQALGDLPDDQKPRVLLLQYTDQGGEVAFNVPPASWIQTELVELAGGVPVWREAAPGGGWTVVNFEQIAAWDPDQIFVVNYFSDVAQTVASLEADPGWRALRAVEEGQLYAFPKDFTSWDQPGPRWILGLTWLAARMHPDRLAGVDIQQEMVRFFEQMYGLSEDVIRESILPRVEGDLE